MIGDKFGSRALSSISPLRHESMKSVMGILRVLEARDYVEILDELDPKNSLCRFRKSFMRESIYQIMLYRAQKKGLHKLMVQYIQDNPSSSALETDTLLNHILQAEDLDSEDKVPFKAKQGLIVRKIGNKVMEEVAGNMVVKRGWLTKQGDKPNRKVEKRLMILTGKDLMWFHNENEWRKKKKPLGVIYLTAVYHCVPANTHRTTDDLNIGTCAWRKKTVEREGRREFIFGAMDETERDEWITSIEYLRAKAVYDNFVTKYCNITFPLKRTEDMGGENGDKREEIRGGVLVEFGTKYKAQVRVRTVGSAMVADESREGKSSRSSQRRTTRLGQSFIALNNLSALAQDNPKDLSHKLKKLYNSLIVTFMSTVSSNSNKSTRRTAAPLHHVPECLMSLQLSGDLTPLNMSIPKQREDELRRISEITVEGCTHE